MSRLESLQSSHLGINTLKSHESHKAVRTCLCLVSSCAGSHGKNQVIRNTCGGHMTITSSSSRLFSAMMISRSELKVVVSAILGHVKQYGDGGLFMAYITFRLISSLVTREIPHFKVTSLFHSFASSVMSYLLSDLCEVVLKVDFSNVRILLAYVRSILTSKTLLNLQSNDCDKLSGLIVETFLGAVPSVPQKRHSDGMFLVGVENQPVSASKVLQGVLLTCPEFSGFVDKIQLHLKTQMDQNDHANGFHFIRAVLVTCSLAGDVDEIMLTSFEATEQKCKEMDQAVLGKMTALCFSLNEENVGIVMCQKVIHPQIKSVLKSQGIYFLDRLGSQVIPYLRDLTGCIPLSSILLDQCQVKNCFGKLTSVIHHMEGRSHYLLLNNDDANVISLLVCSEWEERASELKNCVNTSLQGLSLLAKEPKFLMGGGCWQMNCSAMLEKQVLSDLPKIMEDHSLSEAEIRQMLSMFVSCLRGWCLQLKSNQEHLSFDPLTCHAWRVPKGMSESINSKEIMSCCCGLKLLPSRCLLDMDIYIDCDVPGGQQQAEKDRNDMVRCVKDNTDFDRVVLDSFPASLQALNTATVTAVTLFSVSYFLTDKN